MRHIYRLIYLNYDIIKNKIEITTQYTLIFSTTTDRTTNLTKYTIISLQSILISYQQHINFFLYYLILKLVTFQNLSLKKFMYASYCLHIGWPSHCNILTYHLQHQSSYINYKFALPVMPIVPHWIYIY
jgi:hypothetical protein